MSFVQLYSPLTFESNRVLININNEIEGFYFFVGKYMILLKKKKKHTSCIKYTIFNADSKYEIYFYTTLSF